MDIQTTISALLLAAGAIFLWISAIGVVKFPDFYARLHAAGIGDTLGAFLLTLGIMVKAGWTLLSLKVFVVFLLYLLTNPLGTNLIILEAIHAKDYQGYTRMRAGKPKEDADVKNDFNMKNDTDMKKDTDTDDEENGKGENRNADTAARSHSADGADIHHAGGDIQ